MITNVFLQELNHFWQFDFSGVNRPQRIHWWYAFSGIDSLSHRKCLSLLDYWGKNISDHCLSESRRPWSNDKGLLPKKVGNVVDLKHKNESDPKWTVRDDSGRSFEPKWTVMGQIRRSFDKKWTVLRMKVDGPKVSKWTVRKCRTKWSGNVKLVGPKVLKWTVRNPYPKCTDPNPKYTRNLSALTLIAPSP